jgi:hypothetical protein
MIELNILDFFLRLNFQTSFFKLGSRLLLIIKSLARKILCYSKFFTIIKVGKLIDQINIYGGYEDCNTDNKFFGL